MILLAHHHNLLHFGYHYQLLVYNYKLADLLFVI